MKSKNNKDKDNDDLDLGSIHDNNKDHKNNIDNYTYSIKQFTTNTEKACKYGQSISLNTLSPPSTCNKEIDNWIAFDFEWQVQNMKNIQKTVEYEVNENASGGSEPPVYFGVEEYNQIVTFGFEDSHAHKDCYDITDFASSKVFLEAIKEKLLNYRYCFAWGSKAVVRKNKETGVPEGINGDLIILDSNLKANGISTIVGYDKYSSIPYLKKDIFTSKNCILESDIDLLQVFAKPLVKTNLFKNKYKSLRLNEVSRSILRQGKLDNKSGAKLDEMSVDDRKSYCLHDAHLVAELIRVNNSDALKIMQVIASHTGLRFEEVCHKGMTGIWKRIINEAISKKIRIVGYENISSVLRKLYSNNSVSYETNLTEYHFDYDDEDDEFLEYKENSYDHYIDLLGQKSRNKNSDTVDDYSNVTYSKSNNIGNNGKPLTRNKYKGGLVLTPTRGLYHDVYLFDITSLYPTMIINYNISPETVNCSCCKNDVKAWLAFDKELLSDLHHTSLMDSNNTGISYWTCKRKKGIFSRLLEELTQKRIQYKKEGKELESTAIKAIINSGYGVFGHINFKYYDPKVAEVITTLGRQTLLDMKKIASEMNFNVLYGDTDSLFVNNVKNYDVIMFIDSCKTRLNIAATREKTFRKLILVGKKHYIGIPYENDEPVIKGMEGIKSDRPEFIQNTFKEMVKDIHKDTNPIPKLKQALEELDQRQVPKERLAMSLTLTKNPKDYTNDCLQKRLGSKLRLKKGDTLVYYKCNKQVIVCGGGQPGKNLSRTGSESDDPNDTSYAKYKEMLISTVKDVIEILGYSVQKDLLAKKKLML